MRLPVIYLADHSQRPARATIAAEQRHTRVIGELYLRSIEALAVASVSNVEVSITGPAR